MALYQVILKNIFINIFIFVPILRLFCFFFSIITCTFYLCAIYKKNTKYNYFLRRFNENTCYLLSRNGCFNIREDEDKNIDKIREFSSHHLNPQNIKGIKKGSDERRNILIDLLRYKIGFLLIDKLQLFDTGNWAIFNDSVQDKL